MSVKQARLQSFSFDQQNEAFELLVEGFPQVDPGIWRAGFRRLRETPPPGASGIVGCFMLVDEARQGLSLAIRRQMATGSKLPSGTNLSSWYIRPQHRHRAIWMAKQMVAAPDQTYTDLSPTTGVTRILERIDFKLISSQTLLIPTPVLAPTRSKQSILPAAQTLDMDHEQTLLTVLQDHRALGCRIIAVEDALGVHPLVFAPKRRLGMMNTVKLIYAGSATVFLDNIRAISRYFLMRGVVLIEAQVPDDAAFSFACLPYFKRRYAKGLYQRDVVDQLYSEAVYFPF